MRVRLATFVVLIVGAVGCGGNAPTDSKANIQQQANGRLEAMKALADALAKNASAGELAVHIEGLVSNQLDPATHPDEARELVAVYNTRVKGKLKGDQAAAVKGIVDGTAAGLK